MQNDENKLTDLRSLSVDDLQKFLIEINEPTYRAKQVFKWMKEDISSIDQITNISKSLRDTLSKSFYLYRPKILAKNESKIDGTKKYLWELHDGNAVETVLMNYSYGNTICISTQVGCRQGCAFCASTIGGLIRNLEPAEMLEEVLYTELDSGMKINNIVLMGIGEPLDNFDNVIKFLEIINSKDGMNIGMRHITLSTCGIIEKFNDLAEKNLQLTLTVSLHAPDDITRSKIMPANNGRGINNLIVSCKKYYELTGRRISFEYAMIDGVNDSREHAYKLVKIAKDVHAHINLISLNHVEESKFNPSTKENMNNFIKILEDNGVNVTVRRKLGNDVDASCGQLRRKIFNY